MEHHTNFYSQQV